MDFDFIFIIIVSNIITLNTIKKLIKYVFVFENFVFVLLDLQSFLKFNLLLFN